MGLYYKSTRNSNLKVTASEAILKGLAPDGGLFVPSELPKLDVSMSDLKGKTYQEIAYLVMKQFLTDFTEEELKSCIDKAYDSKFDTEEIAPLVKVDDTYYMELFHGATIAFKDMALSILPHLMTTSAKKNDVKNEIVILTATSGDTGKAALAGFADVEGTRIIVFYPKNGVSKVQELQMVTQRGENVNVVAIHGNFDKAQSGVKAMFEDKELAEELAKKGYQFSSANSINIGRLVPQVVYYVNAYAKLLENEEIEDGEKINVVVPTGNFGNILAAYYAKQMGVPIDKLVCASNDNKVLFDFFQTGDYDRNREFILTTSPSMDILISSNLERLLYRISGDDDQKTKDMMEAVIGPVEIDKAIIAPNSGVKPKAPGMKYRHYAPRADLTIVEGPSDKVVETMNRLAAEAEENGKKVGMIATDETKSRYPHGIVMSLGARSNEEEIAQHLFEVLRKFDDTDVDCIFSESFEDAAIGAAIMNRLLKAAGHKVVRV